MTEERVKWTLKCIQQLTEATLRTSIRSTFIWYSTSAEREKENVNKVIDRKRRNCDPCQTSYSGTNDKQQHHTMSVTTQIILDSGKFGCFNVKVTTVNSTIKHGWSYVDVSDDWYGILWSRCICTSWLEITTTMVSAGEKTGYISVLPLW